MTASVLLVVMSLSAAPVEKPATVRLCFALPPSVALFSDTEQPWMRRLEPSGWMLDFDLQFNGKPAGRITKSGATCLKAEFPAQRVKKLEVSFARVPLNLIPVERAVDLRLQPDRWSDAGSVPLEQVPFSTVTSALPGELKFELQAASGPVVISDLKQLPLGTYQVTYTPPGDEGTRCEAMLEVEARGTVTEESKPDQYRELVAYYRDEVLHHTPALRAAKCQPGEVAQVKVTLVDGTFRNAFNPSVTKVQGPPRPPRYQLVVDGQPLSFDGSLKMQVLSGQHLEAAPLEPQASR